MPMIIICKRNTVGNEPGDTLIDVESYRGPDKPKHRGKLYITTDDTLYASVVGGCSRSLDLHLVGTKIEVREGEHVTFICR